MAATLPEMGYNNYRCSYGKVERRILFYRNKSKYDTRIFKTMLSQAEIDRNALKEMLKLEILNELEEIKEKEQSEVKSDEEVSHDP